MAATEVIAGSGNLVIIMGTVTPGDVLSIYTASSTPPSFVCSYVVQAGDTLLSIAHSLAALVGAATVTSHVQYVTIMFLIPGS